jgi:hypothetical protein
MKRSARVLTLAVVVTLLISVFGIAGTALAAARDASWVVSVTYQNVGLNAASVTMEFYSEGSSTPVVFNPLGEGKTLPKGAAASLFIGSVTGLNPGFRGSAVMSSTEPLVATVVQFSQQDPANFRVRMLSNGFSSNDASTQYLIATTLFNRFDRTTVFSVQNTETAPIRATVRLYDALNAGQKAGETTWTIPGGASKYIEMDKATDTGLGSKTMFDGSAIITAVLDSDGTTPAKVVAAASELYTNRNVGANFEGVPLSRAANTVYMATALCASAELNTAYAVQNSSLTDQASITVTYYDMAGAVKTTDGPYPIGPGQKQSIQTCSPNSGAAMAGFSGSAKIVSTGAPIVAIGKANKAANAGPNRANVFTAFLGEPAGFSKVALPFVRWSNDANFAASTGNKQRSTLAIQSLDAAPIKVNVSYFGKNGGAALKTETLTIQPFSKANSSPSSAGALGMDGMVAGEFGYYTDNTFGGAAIIEAHPDNPNAKFIAIARVAFPGYAEDYNAQSIQ